MRLTKIKLAGFKSFVDPTTIPIPSNLVGIIGPNGCGKSNAIDAVRWVMGESSAKNLRGDGMSDVIFNGSTTRKPVGQASVEMLFDNSEGRAGGAYSHYNEISVKRLVNRDGQSSYFLNSSKCRRRDITDLFSGTGLGPRSYSIIEQGMISRLIEARPEDLRLFLEEAAGISKYKERRRETENRIRHTRENLDRLNDLRAELVKQIEHLQRQAKTAECFKLLKVQQRHTTGQLHMLHWRGLDEACRVAAADIAQGETAIEEVIATQRSIEAEIVSLQVASHDKGDLISEVQERYYSHSTEITRLEQNIQHITAQTRQLQESMASQMRNEQALINHLESDKQEINQLSAKLAESEASSSELILLSKRQMVELTDAKESMQLWQERWDSFNQRAHEPEKQLEIAKAQTKQQSTLISQNEKQLLKIEHELSTIDIDELTEQVSRQEQQQASEKSQLDDLQQQRDGLQQKIHQQRDVNLKITNELDHLRNQIQQLNGQKSSLEALQQAALGQDNHTVNQWLKSVGLNDKQRLAQGVKVTAGWERAVELVLGLALESVCVDDFDSQVLALNSLEKGSLALFDTATSDPEKDSDKSSLLEHVEADWSLQSLMGSVYIADSFEQALAKRHQLAPHESLITQEGIWLGAAWVKIYRESNDDVGVLQREQQLRELILVLQQLEQQRVECEALSQDGQAQLKVMELLRESQQREYSQIHHQLAESAKQLNGFQNQLSQNRVRRQQIKQQQQQLNSELISAEGIHQQASQQHSDATVAIEQLAHQQKELLEEQCSLKSSLKEAEEKQQSTLKSSHDLALKTQSMQATIVALEQGAARTENQLAELIKQRDELNGEQRQIENIDELKISLNERLILRTEVEEELTQFRTKLGEVEALLRDKNSARTDIDSELLSKRDHLEKLRLDAQSLQSHREVLLEKINETGFAFPQLFDEVEEESNEADLQQALASIERKIQRLGLINLAAISEHEAHVARERYLNEQYQDLVDALTTLESAIAKIDRETRARFKDTFNKVNSGFQQSFPTLFGGGQAYLELTGSDLLNTGITVMARPPGKRNSTIHQLSGGEKALTAVALVFAIFELNPAPFCMLDEVDAPLDEANVGRFCKMVESMSERVQFIFITHNKATMEMAQQLNGVTMSEPGVSRIVAVDIKEAYELASQ